MTDIVIHYRDELKCVIECDPGIGFELYEHFAFFVDGYKFNPKYKAGQWDGRIRLFHIRDRSFYVGLLPKLVSWAFDNNYTISFSDKSKFKSKVALDEDLLDRVFQTGKFDPRWYQRDAVVAAIKNQKTLIMSPTGSGKSFMIYLTCRYLLETSGEDILIIVPTTSLVEQLYSDFESYVNDDWSVADNVHRIYSGKEKSTGHRITISTWQSIYKLHSSWFSRFGSLICDEAHQADAKSISTIVENMAHAPFRLGLTGTIKKTKIHELDMQARFGNLIRVATTRQLQDDGDLAQLKIECVQLRYSPDEIKMVQHLDYDREIDFIVSHPKRNKLLAKIAVQQKGNTLMLFNFIQRHGDILYKILQPLCEDAGKQLFYVHGATPVKEREEIRGILEQNSNCIILGNFALMSTGVNIKNLHTIMFCHPYKAAIKTLQSIGRGLRTSSGKEEAKLIDICDDLTYTTNRGNKKMNATFNHFIQRLEIYSAERFKYDIIKVDF